MAEEIEKLSSEFIENQIANNIYQRCPAGGCIVEKISGCNFVECCCGAKFCWNCKKIKGTGNNNCPYGNVGCNSH